MGGTVIAGNIPQVPVNGGVTPAGGVAAKGGATLGSRFKGAKSVPAANARRPREHGFTSGENVFANFAKTLRPWLNGESRWRSPGSFLRKGQGETNRVAGIKKESQKRQEAIREERSREPLRQKREAHRIAALREEILKNPNLELREKLKCMRALVSRPGFDVGLPLLGDATYSRAFFVSCDVLARQQPKPAPDAIEEPAVPGGQAPVGSPALSRSTSRSTQISGLSEEEPLSEKKAPWTFKSSMDSGIEAMSDGEHNPSPEQPLFTRVRRPSSPVIAPVSVPVSAPAGTSVAKPMQVRAVPTPPPAAPATPKARWVQIRHGVWEKRNDDAEAWKMKPVLTTWNRQLGSSVR